MNNAQRIITEITDVIKQVKQEEVNLLVEAIGKSKRVFVSGQGRSGFMIKSFAMRLMHIGIDSYVVGETITPSIDKDDLLIIASGSGETPSLVNTSNKAKNIGATVSMITTNNESSIAQNSTIVIELNAQSKGDESKSTVQPMGSLFEQSSLILFDAIILTLMDKMKKNGSNMYLRHANLE
ncbi:6-phospho-3-hexuloisomerase [Alkalibaculum sp. M08DMB]|uniref:6-phospho-3-hexuloisomerase n=1 Tax=Alkalibaculum sporogenes TaxID=2655001 RepID=A0A6A7K9J2_9FIRM|nr:6-phospho-3-hexuloisomerase [Alkalibaculum sporogenes]MPW26189.1 6-phospho-3-hexuloisomerase [Alkalibaculum sporogenes]